MAFCIECEKCWTTPCDCGWEYRKWDKARRMKLAAVILGVDHALLYEKMNEIVPNKHPMDQ